MVKFCTTVPAWAGSHVVKFMVIKTGPNTVINVEGLEQIVNESALKTITADLLDLQ